MSVLYARALRRVAAGAVSVAALGASLLGSLPAAAAADGPPPLAWAQKAGGTSDDFGYGVAVDASGATTVTGYFEGSATFGGDQEVTLTSDGGTDVFVARYNPDGTLAWATRAGGTSDDFGYGVAVDATGAATVTGVFFESATFGGDQEVTLTSDGGTDVFVARYNPDGTLAWATRAGGTSWDLGRGVAVDATGAATVTGQFFESATFGDDQEVTLTSDGVYDVFVARYNPNGTLAWATRAGGTSDDLGYGVAVDATGATTVTGYFQGSATFGGDQEVTLTTSGGTDVFVARYNPDGTLAWATRAGGTSWDSGYGVAVDATGAVTITGYFNGSATFGSDAQEVTLTSAGRYDVFVARYDMAVPVTPAAVTFTDVCGTGNDTYTIPVTEGVVYLVDGQAKTEGIYPAAETVTVTANAITGFVLAEGATNSWNQTFDATACKIDTTLVYNGAVSAKKGTKITLRATLKTIAGVAIKGQTVKFTLNGDTYSATTDKKGSAKVTVRAPKIASTYPITVNYDGTSDYASASATANLRVR